MKFMLLAAIAGVMTVALWGYGLLASLLVNGVLACWLIGYEMLRRRMAEELTARRDDR